MRLKYEIFEETLKLCENVVCLRIVWFDFESLQHIRVLQMTRVGVHCIHFPHILVAQPDTLAHFCIRILPKFEIDFW